MRRAHGGGGDAGAAGAHAAVDGAVDEGEDAVALGVEGIEFAGVGAAGGLADGLGEGLDFWKAGI